MSVHKNVARRIDDILRGRKVSGEKRWVENGEVKITLPEIIKDGINGFLSEVEDYKTLGNKILTLDADQKLKKSFVDKSYKQVLEGFSTHQMGLNTLNVYKSLVN